MKKTFKAFPRGVRKALLLRTPAGRVALVGLVALVFTAVVVSSVVRARVSPQRDVAASKAATSKAEFVPGEILVRFRTSNAPEADSLSASMPLADGRTVPVEFERFGGSELVEGLRLARVPSDATLDAVAALNARADVLYAAPNYIRRKTATTPNDPSFSSLYALQNMGQAGGTPDADIDADEAWDTTRGSSSVVVGIIDEGVDVNHPDLAENVWRNPGETPANGIDDDGNGFVDDVNGFDFVHGDGSVFDSADGEEHGTHVAGTVGARGNNGIGITGVNWEVSLMSLKVLGPEGGSDSDIIDSYRYAKLMRQRGVNLRVVNNSYGGTGYQPAAADAIQELAEVGILFVAAAGNSSRDNFQIPHYPSDYELSNIISVAATTRFDNLASFSNFGPRKVTMGAPGSQILSTTPNNTYSTFGGTSMASPHVAGVAALAAAANPSLTVEQLYGAVVYGGDANNILRVFTKSGRRLNARGAVQSALEGDTAAPAPAANFRVTAQDGRNVTLAWDAPGDDGNSGTAVDYDFYFVNGATGARYLLPTSLLPDPGGSAQTVTVALPYRNFAGDVELRAYDNAGNFSSASVAVAVGDNAGSNPYDVTAGSAESLSTGGTPLGLVGDDRYRDSYSLPFSFPFFGAVRTSVTVSTNGTLYFSAPPRRDDPTENADDAGGSIAGLQGQAMIAGMWDDLRTDRNNGDVFVVRPDQNTIIFRWQGATFNTRLADNSLRGEQPINFEIELKSDGTIKMRYGAGQSAPTNTRLRPIVGISSGEPQAYVAESHTSENILMNLTNAPALTFTPRILSPTLFTISGRVTSACCSGSTDITGITIALGGSRTATTTTDAGGFYRFEGLPAGGDYTITPQKVGVVFTPASRTFNGLARNETADFIAERRTFRVDGQAKDAQGAPIAGATVVASKAVPGSPIGIPTFTETNAAGQFSFPSLDPGGNYTVSISKAGFVFTSNSVRFDNLSANQTVVFTARLPKISGRVTDGAGAPVGGATVTLSGAQSRTATTDAAGSFTFEDVPRGNYMLAPSWPSGGQFLPFDRSVFDLSGDVTQDLQLVAYILVSGRVTDASGRGMAGVGLRVNNLPFLEMARNDGTFSLTLTPTAGAPVTLTPFKSGYRFDPSSATFTLPGGNQVFNISGVLVNAIDDERFFVRQHYLDFLGREPDEPGLQFWTGNIESCGSDIGCREGKRIDTSAAFFLSIEFQQTGYLVYRAYMAAYGNMTGKPVPLAHAEFLAGTQAVGQGVVVGQGDWQAQIDANRAAYFNQFVASSRFTSKYPETLGADDYARALYATAGIDIAVADLEHARAAFASSPNTSARAAVLRRLAENQTLAQREKNRAFVLMQYFGYLRRNPDAAPDTDFAGYNFWLQKLNQFGGDFRAAEMVKAFITSGEYRNRFRQ